MVKIIDTHVHSWHLDKAKPGWLTDKQSMFYKDYLPEDLQPLLPSVGVVEGILVQADNSFEDARFMFAKAKEVEWIKGVVAWLPLGDPELTFSILTQQYVHETYFKGIRHLMHIEANNEWILQPHVLDSLKLLAQHNIPFDAIGINLQQLKSIVSVAGKIPDLKIVINHLNQPPLDNLIAFKAWSETMKEASTHPNLYAKISGLGNIKRPTEENLEDYIKPALEIVLNAFGSDRVMCGGDWPISLLDREYHSTWQAYLQAIQALTSDLATVEKITYKNGRSFYNISTKKNT